MRTLRPFFAALLLTSAAAVAETPAVRTFAVRTPAGAHELESAVREGAFHRWAAPRDPALVLAIGADVRGDVEVLVRVLPDVGDLRDALAGLPVELTGDAIAFAGTTYRDKRHAFAARLPGVVPLTFVVVGLSARSAADLADMVLLANANVRWRRSLPEGMDYLLWEHRWALRAGRWVTLDDGSITIDDERDDLAERAAVYAAMHPLRRPHVLVRVPPERAADAALDALADELEAAVVAMAPRVAGSFEPSVEVFVHDDFVAQGRRIGEIGQAVLDGGGRLHVVYHPGDLEHVRHGAARALLRHAGLELGPWLEQGAALWLSGAWFGRPYEAWVPDFAAAGVLPDAGELLAEKLEGDVSEVLTPPVAAAVVARLPGERLRDKLGEPLAEAAVGAILSRLAAARGADGATPTAPSAAPTFQSGLSFAMANGLDVGYHAPGVDEQLARFRELGANSVSLMPFAFQPEPGEPGFGFLHKSPSGETDVGLIHAARRAHEAGFAVLWKPHVWVSHGSWPGDIEMTSGEDWKEWWQSYRRFILHHAILAQWSGSELFSVGVELGRTVGHDDEWRALIRGVRRVYSGRLTYSGNWAGDYDQVRFWDALDLIGVDAYFPLSERSDADSAALREGARRIAGELRSAARRFGKQVLLTEVGFAARQGAWVEPHKEGGSEMSETDQRLAYEALLGELGRPPWLAGIYVWKVFSHSGAEGRRRADFRILGREAEAVVRGYFLGDGKVTTAR